MKTEKEMTAEIALPASVNTEMLSMWKAKYRKVSSITVQDDDECYTGFFRRPDMNTISAVSKLSKTDEVKAANALFENCWLGGDEMMREDAIVRMAAIGKLQELLNAGVASLKNW